MELYEGDGPRTKTLTRQIKKTIVKVPTNSCIYAVLRERLKQHGHFSILYKIQLCSIHLCFKYQQLNPLFPFVDIYPLCCPQAFLCNIDFHCNKINELKHHGYTVEFFFLRQHGFLLDCFVICDSKQVSMSERRRKSQNLHVTEAWGP